MMLTFKIVTVAIVVVILALFGFGAYKAEAVLANKAKEIKETQSKSKK